MDWFKFESRIRKVIKELVEPTVNRSKEVEQDTKKLKQHVESLLKREDQSELNIQKLLKKNVGYDEITIQFRSLDQQFKLFE
jgi:hypothetical protein